MARVTKHKPGEFCWSDLGAIDPAGAKKYYRALFGWTVKDFPMGPGGEKYSMLRVRGKDACALYPMTDQQRKMKAPPFWLPYVAVRSVDATLKKVQAAGGKIGMGPMNVMDQGRVAIVMDPTGAALALWQPRKHRGSEIDGVPGTVFWHDLNTTKPAVAAKFYTKVFGWKQQDQDFGGAAYHLMQLGKEAVGGIWPESFKDLGPCWITYFQVTSCAQTVAKAKRLGGRALMGTTRIAGLGHRFAILADPEGAVFAVFEVTKKSKSV